MKNRVEKGEKFDSLAKIFSDDKDTKGFGGFLGKISIEDLPTTFKDTILKLKEGEISGVLPYSVDATKQAYHIIWKKKLNVAHVASLETDYIQIEGLTKQYKQNKLYMDWIESLRKTMYWEIKD